MAPRETENNAYAKFWSDQRRVLWYVMVFSRVVNFPNLFTSSLQAIPKTLTSGGLSYTPVNNDGFQGYILTFQCLS